MEKAHRLYLLLFTGLQILFLKPAGAQRSTVTLAWAPNTETNLRRYVMYRDTIPGTMKYFHTIPKTKTTYVDRNVVLGKTYYYKLTAVDSNGNESPASNEVSTTVGTAALNEGNQNNAIGDFELIQNYPNPFNPSTTIDYSVFSRSRVTLILYDVLGNEVRIFENGFKEPGDYSVVWDGKDRQGKRVSSGVYFYQMVAEKFVDTKKIVMQK